MVDWSLKVAQDGSVELTIGPKPRRTVVLPPDEGRALANAIVRTIDLAESLAATKKTLTQAEIDAIEGA